MNLREKSVSVELIANVETAYFVPWFKRESSINLKTNKEQTKCVLIHMSFLIAPRWCGTEVVCLGKRTTLDVQG